MAKRLLGLLLGLVVAVALLAPGATAEPSCDTNGKSATQYDADRAIQSLRLQGNTQRCQTTIGINSCTDLGTFGTAKLKMCGRRGTCTTSLTAGDALNEVLANCVRNEEGVVRVGGSNEADGLKFVLEGTDVDKVNAQPSCDTNGKSATQYDADRAIQSLRLQGNTQRCQTTSGINSCTDLGTFGTAKLKMCGRRGTCTTSLTAGDALNEVLANCVRNEEGVVRVGGSNEEDGLKFVLEGTSHDEVIKMVAQE